MSSASGRTIRLAGAVQVPEADMEKSLTVLREQRSAALNEFREQHARLSSLRKVAKAPWWGRKDRDREIDQVADLISQSALRYLELSRAIEQVEQEPQTGRQPGFKGLLVWLGGKLTFRGYPGDRRWELAIQLVGVLVVGLSLSSIFIQTSALLDQTRTQTATLRSNAFQAAVNHILELDRMFLENPDIEPYFTPRRVSIPPVAQLTSLAEANPTNGSPKQAKKEQRSPGELASKVRAVAFATLDVFDSMETQREHFVEPGDVKANEAINNWIIESFQDSPVLCDTLKEYRTWYPYLYDWIFTELAGRPCE